MGLKDCTHYWKIETASGPIRDGVCLNCGIERAFRNSIGDDVLFTHIGSPRDSEGTLLENPKKRRRSIVIGKEAKDIAKM